MKTLLRIATLTLAFCAMSGVALAAPHDDGHGHSRKSYDKHYDKQWKRDRDWQREQERELQRRADWQHQRDMDWQRRQQAELYSRAYYQQRYPSYYRESPRYDYRWQRGHRYDGPIYVVRDYGHYRLHAPPRGYHWVRADDRYLLVAIATGIIMDIATR